MTREQWLRYGVLDGHDACGIGAIVDIRGRQSRATVDDALKIVEKLEHRAGKDALGRTGDGVGILTQVCHGFFRKAAAQAGIVLPEAGDYGVGMFFFPQETLPRRQAQKICDRISARKNLRVPGRKNRLIGKSCGIRAWMA